MKFITPKHILRQLKADLIGKDSHRGITLTYAWLANQFGHISLGFIPTLLLYVGLKKYTSIENPIISSVIITAVWAFFELYNFLGPLIYKGKQSKSNLLYLPSNKKGAIYKFKPDYKNVGFDTFTDVCFFMFGAFLCGCFLVKSGLKDVAAINLPISFTILGVLTIVLFFFGRHWYVVKMYQQYAKYPFQFRLSQFDKKISDKNIKTIEHYKNSKNQGNHLLIFGGNYTGKTSLAIGLANELSIKKNICFYTTAIKLFTRFFEEKQSIENWEWYNCEYLVIDDINPGDPINKDIVSPEEFLCFINGMNPRNKFENNKDILKNKNIIWVLGNDSNKRLQNLWENMLQELGVSLDKIQTVYL